MSDSTNADEYARDESSGERLDRHWLELLQELRLAQAGAQIMLAFLLTIGFTGHFQSTGEFTRWLYAGTVVVMAVAMALFLAPVALHRMVFRSGVRDEMVRIAGRLTGAGLVFLLLGVAGGVLLALDASVAHGFALTLTGVVVVVIVGLWFVLPAVIEKRGQRDTPTGHFGQRQ